MQPGPLNSELIPWLFLAVMHLGVFWVIAGANRVLSRGLTALLWGFAWLAPFLLPLVIRWLLWGYMLAGLGVMAAGKPSWLSANRAMTFVGICLGLIGGWYLLVSARPEVVLLGAAALLSAGLLIRKSAVMLA